MIPRILYYFAGNKITFLLCFFVAVVVLTHLHQLCRIPNASLGLDMSSKRSRTEAGMGMGSKSQRRAIAISAKERKKFPYGDYGRAYYKRGTPDNIERFGATYRLASAEQKDRRKAVGYVGRGKYSLGKAFRATIGKHAGRKIRDAAVDMALKAASQYTGQGLYSGRGLYSNSNNLIEGGRPSMEIHGAGDETQGLTISHKEFLQDVYGPATAGFSIEGWALNPALAENFPWLSQFAANYEEYEFIQLVFEFRSTIDASAVNNPSGNTGTIMMATNYNPSAPLFSNKEQMMQYHGCMSGRLTEDHRHGVECDPSKNAGSPQKFTRVTPVVIGQDIKSFDHGQFQLAMVNVPSAFQNQQIGELWVYYTVRLDKPRLFTGLGNAIPENRWLSAGGETATNIFGTNVLTMQQNHMNIVLSFPNSYTYRLTLPDFLTGVFELLLTADGSSLAGYLPNISSTGSITNWADFYGGIGLADGGAALDNPTAMSFMSNSQQIQLLYRFAIAPSVSGVDNTITISTGTLTGSPNQAALYIRQVNGTLGQSPSKPQPVFINSVGVPVTIL